MGDYINKEVLFGHDYNALSLYEHPRKLYLLKRLIEIADEAVHKSTSKSVWNFEGVCHSFANSIVDYSKVAYDNFILGHFNTTYMVYRAVIENIVCLDIILNDEKEELWKYYLVQSYRNTVIKPKDNPSEKNLKFIEKMYRKFDISKEFYEKRENKKAYIDINYGWTYKVNKDFSFSGLCNLVDKSNYDDFKMMSEYAHGTSIYLKLFTSAFEDNIVSIISSIYIGLYSMITIYCIDLVDPDFDEVTEEIEDIIYEYIYE